MDTRDTEAVHRAMVGRQLEIAMRALGMRSMDLEKQYGMGASRTANWRAGLSYPPPLFLSQLCQDTGLTMDFFYRDVLAGVALALVPELRRAKAELDANEGPKKRGPHAKSRSTE